MRLWAKPKEAEAGFSWRVSAAGQLPSDLEQVALGIFAVYAIVLLCSACIRLVISSEKTLTDTQIFQDR